MFKTHVFLELIVCVHSFRVVFFVSIVAVVCFIPFSVFRCLFVACSFFVFFLLLRVWSIDENGVLDRCIRMYLLLHRVCIHFARPWSFRFGLEFPKNFQFLCSVCTQHSQGIRINIYYPELQFDRNS